MKVLRLVKRLRASCYAIPRSQAARQNRSEGVLLASGSSGKGIALRAGCGRLVRARDAVCSMFRSFDEVADY